jgi:hypothetical protein
MSQDERPEAAEFFSDDHKKSHVAALIREREGYEQKVAGANKAGDDEAQAQYAKRVEQVTAELDRLAPGSSKRRAAAR